MFKKKKKIHRLLDRRLFVRLVCVREKIARDSKYAVSVRPCAKIVLSEANFRKVERGERWDSFSIFESSGGFDFSSLGHDMLSSTLIVYHYSK